MKYLTYYVLGSLAIGVGWVLLVFSLRWWRRRADTLAALYG